MVLLKKDYVMKRLKNFILLRLLIIMIQLKKLTALQKLKNKKRGPDHDKYITTTDFNKFSDIIFDKRVEKAKLAK